MNFEIFVHCFLVFLSKMLVRRAHKPRLNFLNKVFSAKTASKRKNSVAVTTKNDEFFELPMRIKRGPTDVLRALASTVGRDETAARYKFMDDPFFIPASSTQRQIYSLSKESGRKAALFFATNFPRLFEYDEDEPRIDTFRPSGRPPIDDSQLFDSDFLRNCLKNGFTRELSVCFEHLNQKNSVDFDLKMKILEFLSFHNCQEPVETEFKEQNFYKTYFQLDQPLKTIWKRDGLAEQIFDSLEEKTPRAYSALICGMSKYYVYDEAYELFCRMRENLGLKFMDENLLNAVLACLPNISSTPDEMWTKSLELLKLALSEAQLSPKIRTFDTLLKNLNSNSKTNNAAEKSLMILREMNYLNVEPSLATCHFLLLFHRSCSCSLLGSLVNFLISRLEMAANLPAFSSKEDSLFFPHAMELICDKLNDENLAYRLNTLLTTSKNPVQKKGENFENEQFSVNFHQFLNDFEAENDYYNKFCTILSRLEEPKIFLDIFNGLFPHIFAPDPSTMIEILENFELHSAQNFIPQIYPGIVASGYFKNSANLITALIKIMFDANDAVDFDTKRKFADIAYDIKQKVDVYIVEANERRKEKHVHWTKKNVARLAEICRRAGQIRRSQEIEATKIPERKYSRPSSWDRMEELLEIQQKGQRTNAEFSENGLF